MTTESRDKMPDRDRDKSVEQWLRQTPVPGTQADGCLDAETLAVWAEGLLEGPARAAAEAHASSCARCQAMLAVMVRTTPAVAASTGSALRKWLMMLGPPMAAAAAVALWFAVDQDRRTPVLDSLGKQQAKAEGESRPTDVMPQSAPPVPLEADSKLPSTSSDAELQIRERATTQALADARKERGKLESSTKTVALAPALVGPESPVGFLENEKKDLAAAKRVDVITGSAKLGAAAPVPVASPPASPPPSAAPRPAESVPAAAGNRPAPPANAAAAPPPQQANQAQNQAQNQNQVQVTAASPAVQRQQQALEERVVAADKAAASAAVAASRLGVRSDDARAFGDAAALSTRAKAGDFELAAAGSAHRWRVVEGRTVQRSLDAGATWSNQYGAPTAVFLTAGTAPSPTVVWLVGRAGAIVLSNDGVAWQRVTFPEGIDLASVAAPDARTATVTTVDGRRFATADGGRTWTRQ